jgi:biopolymer transport protein ExbD
MPENETEAAGDKRAESNVFLQADKDVPYGLVVEVMGEIRQNRKARDDPRAQV